MSSTMIDAVAGLVVELDVRMAEAIPSLPIRAELAAGPVIMFEGDDYIGYPVNVAARLCAQAGPRELLATAEVAALRPGWVHAKAIRSVSVRGPTEPIVGRLLSLADGGETPIVDPVCGLTIESSIAVPGAGDHRFCSEACLGSWRDNARSYTP